MSDSDDAQPYRSLSNPAAFAGRLKTRLRAERRGRGADRIKPDGESAGKPAPEDDLQNLHLNWDMTRVDWTTSGDRHSVRKVRGQLRRLLQPFTEHLARFTASTTRTLDAHERALAAAHIQIQVLQCEVQTLSSPPDPTRLTHLAKATRTSSIDVAPRGALLDVAVQHFSRGPVIDLRCGRGSLLASLQARRVDSAGFDERWEYVTACRRQGLTAFTRSWAECLPEFGPGSVAGVFVPQLLERLPPAVARDLLLECARVLWTGGVLVTELIDADYASQDLLLDGVRPIPSESLVRTLEDLGFTSVRIVQSSTPTHGVVVDDVFVGPGSLVVAEQGATR